MKKLFLLIALSISTIFSFSQNFKGTVLNSKNIPIEGVHVYLKSLKGGELTDKKGRFNLKLPTALTEYDTIYFSHLGYKTKALAYSKNIYKKIYLTIAVEKLKEVSLLKKKELKSKIHFNKLASMKKGVHSFGSFFRDNKIFVFGGDLSNQVDVLAQIVRDYPLLSLREQLYKALNYFSSENYSENFLVYDIPKNTWNISKTTFRKRAFHNVNYYEGNILILGGKRLSTNRLFEYLDDKIEVFNLKDNTIKIDKTNPHQAVDFASFTYKDNLIVIGGSTKKKKNGIKEYLNKVHLYDFKSGNWYELDSMLLAKETNGVLINDKIYLIGGFNKAPLTTIESYDLITGKWKKEGNLFGGLTKPAITQNDSIVYFYEEGTIYTYNIKTKELNEYLINLNLHASKLFYADNKLYLLGGFRKDDHSIIPSSSLYSIDLKEFEKTNIFKSKIL